MTREQALAAARVVCGDESWCEYLEGRPKPYRVGCDTWFRDTLACGDTWEEAIDHLRERVCEWQHHKLAARETPPKKHR